MFPTHLDSFSGPARSRSAIQLVIQREVDGVSAVTKNKRIEHKTGFISTCYVMLPRLVTPLAAMSQRNGL
jgi:hypothetical protein